MLTNAKTINFATTELASILKAHTIVSVLPDIRELSVIRVSLDRLPLENQLMKWQGEGTG
jgi:hypothetical protein